MSGINVILVSDYLGNHQHIPVLFIFTNSLYTLKKYSCLDEIIKNSQNWRLLEATLTEVASDVRRLGSESVVHGCSSKYAFLKIFKISQEIICAWVSF